MKWSIVLILLMASTVTAIAQNAQTERVDYVRLSQDFLYSARTGDSVQLYIDTLASAEKNQLLDQLSSDQQRLAFWLNIYNGFTQVILKNNPEKYTERAAFFSDKQILIAQQPLSLDLIEHGLLRRSKIKWSLGYFNKLFPSAFEKQFRLDQLDSRTHFALNCGAKSCPPIAFYEPDNIESQLDLAMQTYLEGEAEYDSVANVVRLPAIMGWFRGDFGGKGKMLDLLKKNNIIPNNSSPKIKFKEYDWTLFLSNYKS